MGARRLLALISALPRESAFHRKQDPEGSQWGVTDHLLALLYELTFNVNRDERKQRQPFVFPRPGVGDAPSEHRSHRRQGARRVSMADMASMMRG